MGLKGPPLLWGPKSVPMDASWLAESSRQEKAPPPFLSGPKAVPPFPPAQGAGHRHQTESGTESRSESSSSSTKAGKKPPPGRAKAKIAKPIPEPQHPMARFQKLTGRGAKSPKPSRPRRLSRRADATSCCPLQRLVFGGSSALCGIMIDTQASEIYAAFEATNERRVCRLRLDARHCNSGSHQARS